MDSGTGHRNIVGAGEGDHQIGRSRGRSGIAGGERNGQHQRRACSKRVIACGIEAVAAVGIKAQARRGRANQRIAQRRRLARIGIRRRNAARDRSILKNRMDSGTGHRNIVGAGEGHCEGSKAQGAVSEADCVSDGVGKLLALTKAIDQGRNRRRVIGNLAIDDRNLGTQRCSIGITSQSAFRNNALCILGNEIAPHRFAGCDIGIAIVRHNLAL